MARSERVEIAKRGHDRGRKRGGPISEGGDLRRTAPRRRTCVRQAGAWTRQSPLREREHRCPDRDRTLTGKERRQEKRSIKQLQ